MFSRNTSRKQAFSFMLVLLNTKLSVIKPMQLSKACIEYEVELVPVGCLLVVQHDSCRHLTNNICGQSCGVVIVERESHSGCNFVSFSIINIFFLHKQKEEK